MAIVSLQDLQSLYTSEYAKQDELAKKFPKVTNIDATWTSPSSGVTYSAPAGAGGGEVSLLTQLQTVLANSLLNAIKWNSIQTEINNYLLKSGGVLTGNTDFADFELQRPTIKDYAEKGTILTGQSGTVNLDLSLGNNFSIAPTGAVTITLSNWNASGKFHGITIEIVQPASPQAITFPASFKFPNNVAPNVAQASKVSVISGYSRDGGTTVRVNASVGMNA
jgi:hypothetical protein